jgi:hypothetical protein
LVIAGVLFFQHREKELQQRADSAFRGWGQQQRRHAAGVQRKGLSSLTAVGIIGKRDHEARGGVGGQTRSPSACAIIAYTT